MVSKNKPNRTVEDHTFLNNNTNHLSATHINNPGEPSATLAERLVVGAAVSSLQAVVGAVATPMLSLKDLDAP